MKISKRHLRQVIREEYTRLKIRKLYQEKSPLNLSESYESIGELYALKSDYVKAEKY